MNLSIKESFRRPGSVPDRSPGQPGQRSSFLVAQVTQMVYSDIVAT